MNQVFLSYSHRDEAMRDRLQVHLAMLKRNGLIETWHDRMIPAGNVLDDEIDEHLENANVVLLLVSADFLASDYCYTREMARALERREQGLAQVIPIILDHCDWLYSPLATLKAVPKDGKPISKWPNESEAWLDVVSEIRAALPAPASPVAQNDILRPPSHAAAPPLPRSSNLTLRKKFSDADEDAFLEEAFAYMKRYFEGSLQELGTRNPGIQGRYRDIDSETFTARIYEDGKSVSECRISVRSPFGKGINYSTDLSRDNTSSDLLSVVHDDQHLYFTSSLSVYGIREEKLGFEGAAEHFWSQLIAPLQSGARG